MGIRVLKAEIHRTTQKYNQCTLGVFLFEGLPQFLTLELPWLENKKNISCIPEGEYVCLQTINRTTKGGMRIPVTFEVQEVPNRSGILFHIGNYPKDTTGCILMGEQLRVQKGQPTVLRSKPAFRHFLTLLEGEEEFKLRIFAPISAQNAGRQSEQTSDILLE